MNTSTTDTPIVENYLQNFNSQFVPAELARNLERELTEKTNEIARLREELDRLKRGCQGSCYACEPVGEMNLKLEAEVARLRRQIEKLTSIADRACNLLNLKGGYHESYELRNEIKILNAEQV